MRLRNPSYKPIKVLFTQLVPEIDIKRLIARRSRDFMILETSDDIELYYETYGDEGDKPVVLVHGLGAEGGMWGPQIENYPSEGLFLIVPHVRGHGKTSKVKEFRISDCARDIKELLDHLEVDRASLAGVSMGGVIVQQFACDFPDRVKKLVIADSFSEVSGLIDKLRGWSQ